MNVTTLFSVVKKLYNQTPTTAMKFSNGFQAYHIGLIVFSVLVVLTNIFAIAMYCLHKTIRKHLSNVLLCSLAVSDLFIGLVYLPVLVIVERSDFEKYKWLLTLARCQYLLGNFCGFSTIFHIITLTIDKYVAVSYPFKRIRLSTRRFFRKILVCLWLMAFICSLIPLFWIFKDGRTKSKLNKFFIYGIFQLVIFFGVSLLVLVFCYTRMFVKIHRQQCNETSLTERVSSHTRNDKKTILVFLCFFAVFVIGWLPWFLFSLGNHLLHVSVQVKDFLVTLRYAGAFLNPLVYAFFKNDYRQAIKSDFVSLCTRSSGGVQLSQLKNTNQGMTFRSQECQL